MTNQQALLKYIDHILDTLNSSYEGLDVQTKEVLKTTELTKGQRVHLQWGLAHIHTTLCEFERDLNRHKQVLKDIDAGTKI